jgi:hypothetical protein
LTAVEALPTVAFVQAETEARMEKGLALQNAYHQQLQWCLQQQQPD